MEDGQALAQENLSPNNYLREWIHEKMWNGWQEYLRGTISVMCLILSLHSVSAVNKLFARQISCYVHGTPLRSPSRQIWLFFTQPRGLLLAEVARHGGSFIAYIHMMVAVGEVPTFQTVKHWGVNSWKYPLSLFFSIVFVTNVHTRVFHLSRKI